MEHTQRIESLKREFPFVPISNWKGLKFIFLQQSKLGQKLGYSSLKGGEGRLGEPTYTEAVGRIGTVTTVDVRDGLWKVALKMDANGQVYTAETVLKTISDVAPIGDIEKARSLWKGKTLWLVCPNRMSKEISIGLQRYPQGDDFDAFPVRRFSSVKVIDVVPGRYNLSPVRFVLETASGERGFQDCSLSGINGWVHHKELWWDFDRYFFIKDPRKLYSWDDRTWNAVEERKVFLGMSREQAALSWGEPKQVHRTTTARGTHEQWVYGSRNYLYFEKGRLTGIQN